MIDENARLLSCKISLRATDNEAIIGNYDQIYGFHEIIRFVWVLFSPLIASKKSGYRDFEFYGAAIKLKLD